MPAKTYTIRAASDFETYMKQMTEKWEGPCQTIADAVFNIAEATNMPPPILLARLAQLQGAIIAGECPPFLHEVARKHIANVIDGTVSGILDGSAFAHPRH